MAGERVWPAGCSTIPHRSVRGVIGADADTRRAYYDPRLTKQGEERVDSSSRGNPDGQQERLGGHEAGRRHARAAGDRLRGPRDLGASNARAPGGLRDRRRGRGNSRLHLRRRGRRPPGRRHGRPHAAVRCSACRFPARTCTGWMRCSPRCRCPAASRWRTFAIGKAGAKNAALFAAAILALSPTPSCASASPSSARRRAPASPERPPRD